MQKMFLLLDYEAYWARKKRVLTLGLLLELGWDLHLALCTEDLTLGHGTPPPLSCSLFLDLSIFFLVLSFGLELSSPPVSLCSYMGWASKNKGGSLRSEFVILPVQGAQESLQIQSLWFKRLRTKLLWLLSFFLGWTTYMTFIAELLREF